MANYPDDDRRISGLGEQTGVAREIFERLTRIETMLGERCETRHSTIGDHEERLLHLETAEHQRKGGRAALALLAGASGGIIAAVARLLER